MKHGSRTVKGMIERFTKRNITPNKLQALYDGLKANEKLSFLTEILPYCAAKQSTVAVTQFSALSDADLDKLYNSVMHTVEQSAQPANIVELKAIEYSRYGEER